jgi:hypothetical protein
MKPIKILAIGVLFSLVGCATQIQQGKMNDSREQFKRGDLNATVATIDGAFQNKNTLYYLEMGEAQRLLSPTQIPRSTQNLLIADQQVTRWEMQTSERLKRSLSDIGSYLLSEGLSNDYDLKLYEMGLLSQYLSINHIAQGHWNDAMVEAKKMAQREKVIDELIQKKVSAIADTQANQQNNQNTKGSTNRIEEINGYPINLLDDYETRSLKNSYQNPSSYYLSAFIYESQGETSLAAPGYRLATELRPSVDFFKTSLANLDKNIKNKQKTVDADTLIIIDTGYIPKITPFKINKTFNIGSGPKVITMTFPVIEQSSELFTPSMVELGGQSIRTELTSSIDAMARKNLKDDMPAYVLRATSRAIVSLVAQVAADRAAQQRNKNNNNALVGALAGIITGIALQAINVTDVRHWSTLPAQTYMARVRLPVGQNVLKYSTPLGTTLSQSVNLVKGYNVLYLRMFRDKASILSSNDPRALPVKAEAILAKEPPQISTTPNSSSSASSPDEEKVGLFEQLKSYVIPTSAAKAPNPENLAPRPLEKSDFLPPDKVDNASDSLSSAQPNLLDSVKQFLDKKDSP